MPVIESKGGLSSQGFGEFAKTGVATYIEDVFSTYLYTGNSTTGGTQTITNNIDLSTKGGMVWIKGRSAASDNILTDTTRGAGASATNNNALSSNLTSAEDLGGSSYDYLSSFSTTGFVVTQGGTTTATRGTNYNNVTYASWTFRKQPKFFDIVTYTGNGSSFQTVSHNLGSTPGCIIAKQTNSGTTNWVVYHRSIGADTLRLNLTDAKTGIGGAMLPSSTSVDFYGGSGPDPLNASGGTYVAYLFAHNAGGFGLTGTDNVISCGSVGSNPTTVNLGWEPQWLLIKPSGSPSDWYLMDNMRGIFVDSSGQGYVNFLAPNSSSAENAGNYIAGINSTGFTWTSTSPAIYIAIRRGPMKTPTSGTSVLELSSRVGTGANVTVGTSITADLAFTKNKNVQNATGGFTWATRLQGANTYLISSVTDAEATSNAVMQANSWDTQKGVKYGVGGDSDNLTNTSGNPYMTYLMARAPQVYDTVCYTGTGSNLTINHNLTVAPELVIFKKRNATSNWLVLYGFTASALNWTRIDSTTVGSAITYADGYLTAQPTSTQLALGTNAGLNSANTYVAHLFATCAGVSKVGTYTGNGGTLNIDCGFAAGARFIMVKRTDNSGNWMLWNSATGISSGADPYLLWNSAQQQVSTYDYVNSYSTGFTVLYSGGGAGTTTNPNVNGGTYIYIAIA